MFKKLSWYSIIIITVVGFVLLSAGFLKALQVTSSGNTATVSTITKAAYDSTETAATPKEANLIKIVIMGDSIVAT